MCESILQNILTIKTILICFELGSGLRVNFHKRKLGVVGVERNIVELYSDILHCSLMNILFTYLGLPVAGNPSRCSL